MSSITEMPELVIENIIGFLNFRAVFTLRQVCRGFRNFINEMKKSKLPDSKFRKIHVFLKNEEMIRLTFTWKFGSWFEIERYFENEKPGFFDLISQGMCSKYFGKDKSCSIEKDLEIDQVLEVLKFVLKSQKSILQELKFEFNISQNSIIFSKLIYILKSLNQQFQTDSLRILGTKESQFLSILPLIDSKTVEDIRIFPVPQAFNLTINWGMEQVFETEQWKNSSEIHFGFSATHLKLEHFRHFSISDICFQSISAEKLNVLKEFYINSPNFKLSSLTVRHFEETENLSNAWGAPYEFGVYQNWYFQTKNSKILKITCRYLVIGVLFWFNCIEFENVPQGAIIQD
ncbi:hypothetical protein B9Z55_021274 [Caenorhabditis nigoni]|uniref:F-box domain-containing protein n=1 Tax=Caenorhabditis nigoni TaxID=1611254 RepID=A0A2G5TRE5_9PELO|nr:hypothetical protein B9Z55_021274 [Caenorhabditis nigoni]